MSAPLDSSHVVLTYGVCWVVSTSLPLTLIAVAVSSLVEGLAGLWPVVGASLTGLTVIETVPSSLVRAAVQPTPTVFFLYASPTEIYTLSLHDALPISAAGV